MGRRRNAVLGAVLSASLALGLFPAPAIAEAVDLVAGDGFEEVVATETTADAGEASAFEVPVADEDPAADATQKDGEGEWVDEAESEAVEAPTEAAPDEGQTDEPAIVEDEAIDPAEEREEAPAPSMSEEQPVAVPTKTLELEKQLVVKVEDGEELPDHLEFKVPDNGTYSFVVRSEEPSSGKLFAPMDGAQAIDELDEHDLLGEEKNEGELHAWAITKELKKDQTAWLSVAGDEYTAEVWKGEPKDFSRVTVVVNAEVATTEVDEQLAEGASEQPEEAAGPQSGAVNLAALTIGVTDEDGTSLEEGKDYEFIGYLDVDGNKLDGVPTQAGDYEVLLSGMGLWLGEASAKFALATTPTEKDQPAVDTEEPVEQEDPLESAALIDISKASLYIYRDYRRRSSDWADACLYTGSEVKPRVSVYCQGSTLTQDTDYIVTYANNTKAGTATVTVKGIGSYTGSVSGTFVIENSAKILDYVYDNYPYVTHDGSTVTVYSSTVLEYLGAGKAVTPAVSFDSPYSDSSVIKPKSGKDFSVSYEDASGNAVAKPTEVGSYYIVLTGITGGLLTGELRIPFTIVSKLDLSKNGEVSFDNYDFYDSGYTYIRTGSSVAPQIRVKAAGKTLTEGTDYTVTYANNTKAGKASVTVTGMGNYSGSLTKSFTIVDTVDLSTYAKNVTPRVMANGTTTSVYSETKLEYLCIDGEAVRPSVSFYSYSSENVAIQGKDFTVSYTNSSGKAVANPTAAGSYKIVLTAKSGGFLTGSYEIPFSIVKAINLSEKGSASLSYSGQYDSSNGIYTIYDDIDATIAKNLRWSLSAAGISLVENYDYTKSVSQSGNTYTYTFKGKGDYTGSLARKVVVKKSMQDDFNKREVRINNMDTLRINGKYVGNVAYVDAEGTLEAPRVSVEDLAQNADYQVAGFTDANGKAITTAVADEEVYVKLTGLGAFVGCTRLAKVMVLEGTVSADLTAGEARISVAGYALRNDGEKIYYLRKDLKDSNVVGVTTANGYVLSPGQGYSVSKQVSSDQKSMTVTITGTDSRLLTGKTSVKINLVDKYDISKLMESVSLSLVRNENESASYNSSSFNSIGSVSYELDSSEPLAAAYTGYSYMPKLQWLVFKGGGQAVYRSEFTTQLLNASGKSVTAITGAGKYTFVIKGTGDEWTGTIKVPMVVTKTSSVAVSSCAYELKTTEAGKNPTVTLSAGSHTFKQGTDYTVSYGPNSPAGASSWVKISAVKGKGLTGSRVIAYTVPGGSVSKRLSYGDYELTVGGYHNDIYGLKAFPGGSKPAVQLQSRVRGVAGSVLDPKYYTVTYKNYDSFGLATVTVTGKNGYTGSMSANYLIVGVNLSKAKSFVATGLGNVAYTGKAYTPDPVVTVDGVKLKKGTDYTLSYKNNTDAGTASVVITGKGNYSGSVTKTFKITGTSIATVTLGAVADQAYTGSAVKPGLTVKSGSKTLKAGKDYTLSYANNVNVGNKATVTVTGKGGYTGTKTVQFRIAFKDVSKSHWAYDKIHRANDLGLINGYSGSKTGGFGPSDQITRGQIAVMLWNVAGKPKASGGKAFPDVKSTAYYAKAVAWASSAGVVNGYANGKFGPNDPITREQLAVMVTNYAKRVGGQKASGSKADIAKLSDASSVSGYAVPSVAWCYKNGAFVLQSGKLNAKAKADRATAAQMAVDLYDLLH